MLDTNLHLIVAHARFRNDTRTGPYFFHILCDFLEDINAKYMKLEFLGKFVDLQSTVQ